MMDIDAKTSHTSISDMSIDQTVRTMMTSVTALTKLITSVQEQKRVSVEN